MEDKPILLIIHDLIKPIEVVKNKLLQIKKETLDKNLHNIFYEGVLVLAVSSFEYMINEILAYYLTRIPEKLDIKEAKLSKEELLENDVVNIQIKKRLSSLSYRSLKELLEYFFYTLSIPSDIPENTLLQVLEIKERRNLLLHNNMIVNSVYLDKLREYGWRNCPSLGEKLVIDKVYLNHSFVALDELNSYIQGSAANFV